MLGFAVGTSVGISEGSILKVGVSDGDTVDTNVGKTLGELDGARVGLSLADSIHFGFVVRPHPE